MEKQRSFSIKSTKYLVFSSTIFCSLLFFTFFTFWLIKNSTSFHQETQFQLKNPSLYLSPKITTVHDLNGFIMNHTAAEVEHTDLDTADLRRADNVSKTADFLSVDNVGPQSPRKPSEAAVRDPVVSEGNGFNSNLTKYGENFSASGVNNSVSMATKISELGNVSIFGENSFLDEVQSWESEIYKGNAVSGNSGSKQQNESDTSSETTKRPNSDWKIKSTCDVTKGMWVFDESYPLYTNVSCPFIDEGFNCQANGRLDKEYMKWRWQPQDCDIPRFNATNMLEIIRGKRLVFVGDSINRNQWESMLCLLMGAIKDPKRVYEAHGRRITKGKGNYCFKFMDCKCTVEYYASHFLVHESKAKVGKRRVQTLQIDSIDRGSSRWKGADILIFNTAHWWTHYKTKAGINYYQEGDQVHPRLDVSTAFQRALLTWASWVDKHIKPRKTQVFFRSSAPSHFRGGQWNEGGHCKEASWPINNTWRIDYPEKNIIVEEVIRQMKTPVTLLNVTSLSQYRIDGHPSMYGRKAASSSSDVQDCSHWCLPGVPDTWNELLYFQLLSKRMLNSVE